MHEKRKKIWINRFQTVLFWRIAFYFLFYQIAVWSLVLIEVNMYGELEVMLGTGSATNLMLLLVALVVGVGILFIYDAIKFTHKIVGPIVRFRQICQAVRDGEAVNLVKLRDGDYLLEFRDEFNEMLKALEERGAITINTPASKGADGKRPEAANV
jgi:hypothetical protein